METANVQQKRGTAQTLCGLMGIHCCKLILPFMKGGQQNIRIR